jgi:GAF domain-containing protein
VARVLLPWLLPVITAATAVFVAFLLLPATTAAWIPLMVPAVAASAWFSGLGPAVLAVVLGMLGRVWLFDLPASSGEVLRLAGGSALLVTVALLVHHTRRTRDDREDARRVQRDQADRAQRAVGARRAAFLAHASEVLASSSDYATTLTAVANLAVPQIADLCIVDVLPENGAFRALAIAHVDPVKVQLVRELRGIYPLDPKAPYGPPRVLRTGRSVIYTDLTDPAVMQELAGDQSQLRVSNALGLRSTMAVPLLVGGRRLGVISFATAESNRRFVAADLLFAEDLARRAAIAIDAARP